MSNNLTVEWLGRICFDDALRMQDELVPRIRAGHAPEHLFLLEHEPVFTIGRTRDQSSLIAPQLLPYPLHYINRGGQATYHGPGQIVAYPMLDLHRHGKDLFKYLRFLEQVIIETIAAYRIVGIRREGLTGVWVENRKIASIGVGVRHWVTMHGIALNIHGELDGFRHIIPCGINGVRMTSIDAECGQSHSVESVGRAWADAFVALLPTLRE